MYNNYKRKFSILTKYSLEELLDIWLLNNTCELEDKEISKYGMVPYIECRFDKGEPIYLHFEDKSIEFSIFGILATLDIDMIHKRFNVDYPPNQYPFYWETLDSKYKLIPGGFKFGKKNIPFTSIDPITRVNIMEHILKTKN